MSLRSETHWSLVSQKSIFPDELIGTKPDRWQITHNKKNSLLSYVTGFDVGRLLDIEQSTIEISQQWPLKTSTIARWIRSWKTQPAARNGETLWLIGKSVYFALAEWRFSLYLSEFSQFWAVHRCFQQTPHTQIQLTELLFLFKTTASEKWNNNLANGRKIITK